MKVLQDEDLDHRLRKCLGVHEVFTVRYLGWAGLKNGELLVAAEQGGMDVFVTGIRISTEFRSTAAGDCHSFRHELAHH